MSNIKVNNKWSNHLLNFLTVILGVYLAFYINEKAKFSAEKKEGLLLMNSIMNDLSTDIDAYNNYQIPVNTKHQENLDSLLIVLSTNELTNVNDHLPYIFQIENYSPTASTYNSMKFSGKTKLIKNQNILNKLNDFYDGLALECVQKNKVQVDFFMNELLKWLSLNADLVEMELLNKEGLIVLRNKVLIYKSLIDQKIENYKMIVDESNHLKGQLDSLIKVY